MKKAFLIIDMSNDFVADSGALTCKEAGQAIVEAILKTANEFCENGDIVAFGMDQHKPDDEHFELWPPHNIVGTEGAELYGKLKEFYDRHKDDPNVIFVPKGEYDAFYETDLAKKLRDMQVDTVRVSGVCTDICVYNTVYGAYKAKFKTQVSPHECATFTKNGPAFIEGMKITFLTEILD